MLLGSMFSLMGAVSLVYVAFRAHTVGTEVSEMKEILRDIRRAAQDGGLGSGTPVPPGAARPAHEPGEWPSVVDPEYNSANDYSEVKRGA